MEIPKLDKDEYSLFFAEYSTGNIFNSDLTLFNKNQTKIPYLTFKNYVEVESYALNFVENNVNFECIIYDEKGQFLKILNIENLKLNQIERKLKNLNNTSWKSFIEERDFTSGSSFIMVNSENTRENDIEILGANKDEIDFIANSKDYVKYLLKEIHNLKTQLNKK